MYYKNRIDAAEKLSSLLIKFKDKKDVIVLALPRGGVIIGNIIAKNLNLEFDVIIPKKIISPTIEELAIGAVCENSVFLNKQLIKDFAISDEYIKLQIEKQKEKILERKKLYKRDKSYLNVKGKTIILVDDGIATGATIIASIYALKEKQAKKIIIATPLAPYLIIEDLKKLVDEVICPFMPDNFYAIGQYYDNFEEISDEEVIKILK
jgi:predicted phosphoribosyltransferase